MTHISINRTLIAIIGCILTFLSTATSCIEDGFTTSPSARPQFSTDTLKMGTLITGDVSTTYRFTVRNPNNKGLVISNIRLEGTNADCFRLNVDGFSGTDFNGVEIRANDSIYVLVSTTLPANGKDAPVDMTANIAFTTNGSTDRVVLSATAQDVERMRAVTVDTDRAFQAGRPIQVFDSLVVAPGATLTLPEGTRLLFHDKAYMRVYGTLICNGTRQAPVEMRGDRTGDVITGITFDLMAGQWTGLVFEPGSTGKLSHTKVRNTAIGVVATSAQLEIVNSRLRNSQDVVLDALDCDITAVGSEFAEASCGVVRIAGGTSTFDQCTFANYYLFSAIYGPAIGLSHLNADSAVEGYEGAYTKATFSNSIIYGLGKDLSHGNLDDTDVYLRSCLLKSAGSDDDHFVGCLWDSDPLYYTVREDYIFDYRLQPESPAIGAGNAALSTHPAAATDAYGNARGSRPDLGAYVFREG